MEQQVRYCTTSDGIRIAYATMGDGPPLVWVPGWLSHLELDLTFPPFAERCEQLARDFTLVRLDKRGTGLSQRDTGDLSLDAHVLDVAAVVAALELTRFALVGYSEGGPISITYTSQHPAGVSHLVLIGTFASGARVFGGREMQRALFTVVKNEWGLGSKVLADFFFGENTDPSVQRMFALYQQQAASISDAASSAEMVFQFDVTSLLPTISAPTLVIHARDDRTAPIEGGQEIAAAIPGARFISLAGNHIPDRKQAAQMDAAIREFVLGPAAGADAPPRTSERPTSSLVTVLFTDLVGHSEMMSRLGDERGRAVLREHERITREVLKAHGGIEVKTMGDGFMASFRSVTRAVECAVALQRAMEALTPDPSPVTTGEGQPVLPLKVRIGLNAGEPIEEAGDLFGATVILASRIAAKGEGGEILCSDVVRGLCAGKGFLFSDRGEFVAKGFEEPARVYEVRWREE